MFSLFNILVFLTGFLILNIQLVFSKAMLPIFGGSPNIWIASLAFYQTVLTLGYGYSYFLQKKFSITNQFIIHILLLTLCSLIFIPISINYEYINFFSNDTFNLFLTIFISIGLPYFLVTATSPLLQSWFGNSTHTKSKNPYLLYVSSNIGTFGALLCYPFLIEYYLNTDQQMVQWSILFTTNIVLLAITLMILVKKYLSVDQINESNKEVATKNKEVPKLKKIQAIKWMILAFIPSAFLSTVTNKITIDIAPIPLMWVIPLGLYFLSFSIGFTDKIKHQKNIAITCLALAIVSFAQSNNHNIYLGLFFISFLFLLSVLFHNKLYLTRPDQKHLTLFYLFISIGGATGGIFIGVISPIIFNGYYEFLILCILISLCCIYLYDNNIKTKIQISFTFIPLLIIFSTLYGFKLYKSDNQSIILKERTFYGVYTVKEKTQNNRTLRTLIHGNTLHGGQVIYPEEEKQTALSYYSKFNPMALFKDDFLAKFPESNNFGIVGLGTGAMNCFFENKNIVFYEIDSLIVDIAKTKFNYLEACKNEVSFILGDARLSLDKSKKNFDLLYIDAFSSDAIPTHLITINAIHNYLNNIKDNGA